LKVLLGKLGLFVVILAIWQSIGGTLVPLYIVSRPSDILARLIALTVSGELWQHTNTTLTQTFWAYVIGVAVGLLLAFGLYKQKWLAAVLEPFIFAINGIPRVAIAPIFIIWLGIGMGSKIAVGASMAFFPIFLSTYTGLKNLDGGLVGYARLLGASESLILRQVVLPGIAPYLISGLKMAVPQTIVGVVVGEYIAAFSGLGWFIQRSAALFDSASLFAATLVLLVIVSTFTGVISLVEKRWVRWKPAGVSGNGQG
jgi:NitT/TauT family transport system permease protein